MGGKMMQDPRPINTNIKTKLINPEKEMKDTGIEWVGLIGNCSIK